MMKTVILCCALLMVSGAAAEEGGPHSGHGQMPVEAGQSAFASIAEIVAMLQGDPSTDWSKVNIGALRAHLVDMDSVILHARAEIIEIDGGLEAEITGDGPVRGAVQRMVIAHARELDAIDGWSAAAALIQDGASLRVVGTDAAEAEQIRALGFFGLMATGAHHQAHHWAIATGGMPHNH